MRTVTLHGAKAAGRVALVDDADYDRVMAYRWHIWENPPVGGGPYAIANTQRADGRWTTLRMHKLLTGYRATDHEDHDGLNNQRVNLRTGPQPLNQGNELKGAGSSSRFKGVTWNKACSKWQAQIKVNRRNRYLGLFTDDADAARAYDRAALEAFGDYAWLNLPAEVGPR